MAINRDYSQFLREFHSGKFRSLRDAQDYVLRKYATNYTTCPDVAIELPTGSGKTLAALLIAEAWRQEGKKVATLSANKTLARQMLAEADALGIRFSWKGVGLILLHLINAHINGLLKLPS